MRLEPHKGAGGIGGAGPDPGHAPAGGEWSLTPQLPAALSPAAALAMLAFGTNRALTWQVGLAHVVSEYALGHSRMLAQSSEAWPAGPIRDALQGSAAWQSTVARELAQAANRFGRSFGHAAFAFPVMFDGRH